MPTRSLARRILVAALLFMIIPLFIQSAILYKKEYHHIEDYYFHFASLIFFVGVIGGGALYLFTRRVEKPLKNLCKTMEMAAHGNPQARYKSDWAGFEINGLGLQFNATLDAIERQERIAEEERQARARLTETLRIGHDIQAGLLPVGVVGVKGVDIETRYIASSEVSGDFYDLFLLDDGNLMVAVADVAGKGISACLFSLGLRSMLRSLASTGLELSSLVSKVNDLYLIDSQESSTFATLWVGIYHPETGSLSYCSQGHPPALLRHDGEIEELSSGGIVLGAQPIEKAAAKTVKLHKGDLLLLYTDGVTEAHNRDGALFGMGRLKQCLLHAKHEAAEPIAEAVRSFSQGTLQHDDLTLVLLRIK